MKYSAGSVLNMIPAQPGWRVVTGFQERRGEATQYALSDIIAWAIVLVSDDEDAAETSMYPVFVGERDSVTNGFLESDEPGGGVLEILQPGENSMHDAKTAAERIEEETAAKKSKKTTSKGN